jgi:dihydrofolate synthase/folylpolyglutamate synthase
VDFRERIRISGHWVDQSWLEAALDRIESLPEGQDRTFFEVATALGFLYFAEQQVEIAVVEVGLGGRLDCTNVLTPLVSVITSIGLDHTEILGDTLERIAHEKGGILKPGVPASYPTVRGEARRVLDSIAHEIGVPVRPTAPVEEGEDPNQACARDALGVLDSCGGPSVPPGAIQSGFDLARWPGRFERCQSQPRLWWDGAHNPQGIAHLGKQWRARGVPSPAVVVLAVSRDKDLAAMIAELRAAFGPARLIATRSHSERAADPAAIVAEARRQGTAAESAPDVRLAVERALAQAGEGEVLLTGSLFGIGEAMEAWGGAPGADL